MNDERRAALEARILELITMGFTKAELKPVIEAEFSYALSHPEFDELFQDAKQQRERYDFDPGPIHGEYHQTLQRMNYVQGVMLNVFQLMQKNFQAAMEGRAEHDPDPETGEVYPVIAVKPLELASLGEKILKIDQDRVSAILAYPRHFLAASAAQLGQGQRQAPALEDVTRQFIDLGDDDADF
jgi:hypothetical protein